MAERIAAIDVGTNTVLLLVAERAAGGFAALRERAEITRLGRGVDATGRLDPAAIRETVEVLAAFAGEARALGASRILCVATSAARDARNGRDFFEAARARAGIVPEVITGEEEARLVHGSAWQDFGGEGPLAVLDVGGGSTEFTLGEGPLPRVRHSLQVGAVRLTERHVRSDPPSEGDLAAVRAAAREALRPIAGAAAPGSRLVAVAGTVTTLSAVRQALPAYDAARVHGSILTAGELEDLLSRLERLPLSERAALPGMEPKRADVIVAGCAIVLEALSIARFPELTVSNRGVRWGLLHERAGGGAPVDPDGPSR
jgi:exopolyphosphatase/guanosine-5'-triphosphate,3'-diphosphate pyrophosphatase